MSCGVQRGSVHIKSRGARAFARALPEDTPFGLQTRCPSSAIQSVRGRSWWFEPARSQPRPQTSCQGRLGNANRTLWYDTGRTPGAQKRSPGPEALFLRKSLRNKRFWTSGNAKRQSHQVGLGPRRARHLCLSWPYFGWLKNSRIC